MIGNWSCLFGIVESNNTLALFPDGLSSVIVVFVIRRMPVYSLHCHWR